MPIVVVTGAGAGIGRATVRAFARKGAWLALVGRGREGLEAAAKEVEAEGGRALVLPLDVADADAVEEAAGRTEDELGPVDVWVNNAMASVFSPVHQLTAEEVRRVTEVTYLGYVHGTLSALRRMRARDRGTIVQVGSALAHRAIPLQAPYCGAKHAIEGFTEALRCELLHDRSGVRVTTVNLPALNTPQAEWVRTRLPGHPQPVPPIYQPEVAATAIVWAASRAPREMSVGGTTALTVLADKLVPGLLDRYLARTGYDSQQLDEPVDPSRRDNLFEPVPGDHGAHGRFDDKATDRSLQLVARMAIGEATGLLVRSVKRLRAERHDRARHGTAAPSVSSSACCSFAAAAVGSGLLTLAVPRTITRGRPPRDRRGNRRHER
ncbi:MAG TPA: SDR family oxidoreductase [Acidimicrobiales bacterium]|nr:SDR family oxidoreductase [Acidimicrobiales bacterium]